MANDDSQFKRFGSDLDSKQGTIPTALPYEPPASNERDSKKSNCGCWAFGCGGLLLAVGLLIVAMVFGSYLFLNKQVEKYTDTEPTEMPIVEMDEEELARLQERVESFSQRLIPADADDAADEAPDAQPDPAAGDQPLTLVLSADEINALIQTNESIKGNVHVVLEDGRVKAQISIPTDNIPGMGGRYLNADVELEVSLKKDVLMAKIIDANVKGEPLPAEFMESLSGENLAGELNKNPDLAKSLSPFESIEVIEDKVHLKLKPVEPTEGDAEGRGLEESEVLPAEGTTAPMEPPAEAPLPFEPSDTPAELEPALAP